MGARPAHDDSEGTASCDLGTEEWPRMAGERSKGEGHIPRTSDVSIVHRNMPKEGRAESGQSQPRA